LNVIIAILIRLVITGDITLAGYWRWLRWLLLPSLRQYYHYAIGIATLPLISWLHIVNTAGGWLVVVSRNAVTSTARQLILPLLVGEYRQYVTLIEQWLVSHQ